MARYKSICIGGVADGHVIEKDEPKMHVELRKKNAQGEMVLESTDYRFLILLANNDTEIGVWAPQDVPIHHIVARLVRFYNPRTGLIGTPPPDTGKRVEYSNKKNG